MVNERPPFNRTAAVNRTQRLRGSSVGDAFKLVADVDQDDEGSHDDEKPTMDCVLSTIAHVDKTNCSEEGGNNEDSDSDHDSSMWRTFLPLYYHGIR